MAEPVPGKLHVANDVLADMVGHAAMECYGIVGMVAPNAADGIAKILPPSRLRRGIVLDTTDAGVSVDLYVVIDELADLMVSIKKETLPLLQRLAQIGRAARVHVIACTQNVLAVTIPTVLKCNFSTILGLRTCNAQQSRFLISTTGCEMLPDPKREGKGYGFIRDGADLEKILIYKYPDDQVDAVINWWTSSACIAV